MFDVLIESLKKIVGLEYDIGLAIALGRDIELTIGMVIRGFILYFSTIFLIKINKKFLGVRSSDSFLLFIMLGSICATAVTGDAPFISVFFTILILILMNKTLAIIFFYYPGVESFFTGESVLLVSNGQIQWQNMKKHHITKKDLFNALQTQLHTDDLLKIDRAYLATDGAINFIVTR